MGTILGDFFKKVGGGLARTKRARRSIRHTKPSRRRGGETFMLFVKHKGKIPAKFAKKPAIRKKWKAVAEIVKRVSAETR